MLLTNKFSITWNFLSKKQYLSYAQKSSYQILHSKVSEYGGAAIGEESRRVASNEIAV